MHGYGLGLAFGGVTTFAKYAAIREAARITPVEQLLMETDSPYLAPVPHRGKRHGAGLRRTHRKISRWIIESPNCLCTPEPSSARAARRDLARIATRSTPASRSWSTREGAFERFQRRLEKAERVRA